MSEIQTSHLTNPDLRGFTIEAVLTKSDAPSLQINPPLNPQAKPQIDRNPDLQANAQNDLKTAKPAIPKSPRHKYEKIVIHGFAEKMDVQVIQCHPLIRLLHDHKRLMLHGDRGDEATRKSNRKKKRPYENHYCRIGLVYTISQDPETFDVTIRCFVNTALKPIWTNYDGSTKKVMTAEEVTLITANFIDSYITEAEAMIRGETASCLIESVTVIEATQTAQK